MNSIYLRRRWKILLKPGEAEAPVEHLATFLKNIESLGFALAPEIIDRLRTLDAGKLGSFYKRLIADLKEAVGAHRVFKPMYPDYPEQVMRMSNAGLYLNAVLHYLTNELPARLASPREPLEDKPEPRVIGLGTREDFETIFTLLAASRTPLSEQDKKDAAWFIEQYRDDIGRLLPPEVPVKENVALIGAGLMRNTTLAPAFLDERIKTPTDALRLAAALAGGDVSLAAPVKFGKFSRAERRLMLGWLERHPDPAEDMLRWKERWKRLGERLHPGDYAAEYPKAHAAFQTLRRNLPHSTFNGKLERFLAAKDPAAALEALAARPGDFARRLDHLARLGAGKEALLAAFERAAPRVSTPVLLQVHSHFIHRGKAGPLRVFFPKGNVAKVHAEPNRLPPLPGGMAAALAARCEAALVERFAKLPPLGRCWLDPALSDYLVPFSQRSAAKSLRTLVRGSRAPIPDCDTLRFFLWWKNGRGRADIDLSAALFDSKFGFITAITYYNLKELGGHHSGDIVDAPNGAAEFIDVDLARFRARGARYIVMCLNSFTEQPFCDLPECFAGWMAREHPGSGEIFEPRTVRDRIDIASDTRICIPAIFDIKSRKAIWADIGLKSGPSWNNVRENRGGISLMLRAMAGLKRCDLATLFGMHVKARGERVEDPERAETVFSVHRGITPLDLDRIAAEFMG